MVLGQPEEFLGQTAGFLMLSPHRVVCPQAIDRLKQVGDVIQLLAERARTGEGSYRVVCGVSLARDQRRAERQLQFEFGLDERAAASENSDTRLSPRLR